jgi:hypothetical protein
LIASFEITAGLEAVLDVVTTEPVELGFGFDVKVSRAIPRDAALIWKLTYF